MQTVDFETWRANLIFEIDSSPNTTVKGDRFVQIVLRHRFQLSEDDAINATDSAGVHDWGIDAIHIEPAEDGLGPRSLVIQGKYGSAGDAFSPYQEFRKFARGLQLAREGQAPTGALQQCTSVLDSGGTVEYLFATVDPLQLHIQQDLEDVRALAHQRFGEQVIVDAISLADVYREITGIRQDYLSVELDCLGVAIDETVFIGAATLVNMYRMLHQYARAHNGVLDSIYDRNVRKWLGKRARSVNAGIIQTLKEEPEGFVAYNNGITIVCQKFARDANRLVLDTPQIVNGCQTTRTLYDYLENHFAGLAEQLHERSEAERYRSAWLQFKVIAVENLDTDLVKNVTRFSNRQNAVRGRDFLTLEDDFRRLREVLKERGYYLEVQTGEYNVLPKAERDQFPRSRLINAFDALRFYGAGVLGKPHTAFGRSGDFTPGGRVFDDVMQDLSADDLIVPWLIAQDAWRLGYSVGAKWGATGEDHRNQTRYFFLYVFFRTASEVLRGSPKLDSAARHQLYAQIVRLRDHDDQHEVGTKVPPYRQLLETVDGLVATYMELAKQKNWYTDRNSFLKRDELLDDERLIMVSGPLFLRRKDLRDQAAAVLGQSLD